MTIREVIIVLVVAGFLAAIGAAWLQGHHAGVAAERPKTEAAADNASARTQEVAGERQMAAKAAEAAQTAEAAAQLASEAAEAARSAPDANDELDADRVARLRDHDEQLCRLAPELVGCGSGDKTAASGAAKGGDGSVRDLHPAQGPAAD